MNIKIHIETEEFRKQNCPSPQRSVVFERIKKDSDRAILFSSLKIDKDNNTIILPS